MMRVPRSLGLTPWLAAAVAVLLPALAWLQFDWVNQLAEADRERRQRTLRAAGAQFTSAVDQELARLSGSLQLDGAMVERRDWDAYALRYDAALDNGADAFVTGVWFAEIDEGTATTTDVRLHQWMPELRVFAPVDWPPTLVTLRDQLGSLPPPPTWTERRGPRELAAWLSDVGDERTLLMPIMRVQVTRAPELRSDRLLSDVRMRGFTIVRLDTDALARERLPALAAEHFPADAGYRVAVVANADHRVLFTSDAGAATDTADAPDLTTPFMERRGGPLVFFARLTNGRGPREPGLERLPPPPPDLDALVHEDRVVGGAESRERPDEAGGRGRAPHARGYWTLRVKHAAGSLEAAVAASRRRNLAVSGGTLALLAVAVALMSGSARRAHALARQHMEFVAAVTHELRTPVAVINSAAGNLADGVVSDPARVERYGATIQAEARRLGDTVERVLQLAGLGSGRPLPMTPISTETLVRDAVDEQAPEAAKHGVDVTVHLAPHLPDISGEASSLRAAVANLIGNAIKYAGDDRWVRVSAVGANTPGSEVRIMVEDHGVGLDAAEQRRVFEPFYRGRHAVANQVQGSGVGLSLVRRIVEAHGGRVDLASEPGRGSTFTIQLPAARQSPLGHTTASTAAASSAS